MFAILEIDIVRLKGFEDFRELAKYRKQSQKVIRNKIKILTFAIDKAR